MSDPATDPGSAIDGAGSDAARRLFWAVATVIGGWLLLSALTVNIDFDDGYSTIVNSQSLLGITPGYFWQRGPGMAALLMPAEWVADRLRLPAFDVRAHHLLMASLHLLYLLGTWRILSARFGARPEVLIALTAALLTPVFFGYAPFISHDIFPGLLTLLMARLATDYMNGVGRRRCALMLVPVVAEIWNRSKQYRWALLAILIVDLARSVPEAGRLAAPFYREAVTGFLEPLPAAREFGGKVIVERALSFVSPDADAYFGDRYHRITHVTTDQIRMLHGYSDTQWLKVDYSTLLDETVVDAGDFLIMATDIAVRRPPFRPGNVAGLHPGFIQAIGVAEWIDLELVDGSYSVLAADRTRPRLLLRGAASKAAPIIGSGNFEARAMMTLLARDDTPARIRVLGFRLLTLCRVSGCERVG